MPFPSFPIFNTSQAEELFNNTIATTRLPVLLPKALTICQAAFDGLGNICGSALNSLSVVNASFLPINKFNFTAQQKLQVQERARGLATLVNSSFGNAFPKPYTECYYALTAVVSTAPLLSHSYSNLRGDCIGAMNYTSKSFPPTFQCFNATQNATQMSTLNSTQQAKAKHICGVCAFAHRSVEKLTDWFPTSLFMATDNIQIRVGNFFGQILALINNMDNVRNQLHDLAFEKLPPFTWKVKFAAFRQIVAEDSVLPASLAADLCNNKLLSG